MFGRPHTLLGDSPEFREELDTEAQLVFEALWRRGAPQTFTPVEGGDAIDAALLSVRHRGRFLALDAPTLFRRAILGKITDARLAQVRVEGLRVVELAMQMTSAERAWKARADARAAERAALGDDPEAVAADQRAEDKRQRNARTKHLTRARGRDPSLSREEALSGYFYKPQKSRVAPPGVSTGPVTPPPPVTPPLGGVTPVTGGGDEGSVGEGTGGGEGLEDPPHPPENQDDETVSETARTTPPPPVTLRDVTPGDRVTPPPPLPPHLQDEQKVMGLVTGASLGRIGDGIPIVRAAFLGRLAAMNVSFEELKRMALLAREGLLLGQKERWERGVKATDLHVLAAPKGEPVLLQSWVNATRAEIATERAARERAAREDAERRRRLTPNVPVQTELGIPSNEVPDGPPGGAREGPGPARATPNTPLTSGINFKPTKGAL